MKWKDHKVVEKIEKYAFLPVISTIAGLPSLQIVVAEFDRCRIEQVPSLLFQSVPNFTGVELTCTEWVSLFSSPELKGEVIIEIGVF